MAHGYKEGFWLNKQMLTKYVQMWAHRATVWELLWEIWERRAWHGKHPWLVACPLPTWVDTGTVNPYKVWLLTPRGFLWYTWYELKPIMFKIALPFSICASEKGTYKRKVFQNPNSGIDPKWGIFFASSPWMFSFECWNSPPGSSLGARHPGQQSRPQCSLHNTLQAWPGARCNNHGGARLVSESRQKCFLRRPLLDDDDLADGNIYRASASSYASWKPLLSSRTRWSSSGKNIKYYLRFLDGNKYVQGHGYAPSCTSCWVELLKSAALAA